jgi:hypothetical protein
MSELVKTTRHCIDVGVVEWPYDLSGTNKYGT